MNFMTRQADRSKLVRNKDGLLELQKRRFAEKLAELIIRECSKGTAGTISKSLMKLKVGWVVQKILWHIGEIEE
jgi:hypothetical protein